MEVKLFTMEKSATVQEVKNETLDDKRSEAMKDMDKSATVQEVKNETVDDKSSEAMKDMDKSATVQEVKNETVDDKSSEVMKDAVEAYEEGFMNLTEEEYMKSSEEIKAMKAAGFMVKTAEKKSATVDKTEDSKQFEALVKQAQSPSASPGLKLLLETITMVKLYGPDDDDVAQDK